MLHQPAKLDVVAEPGIVVPVRFPRAARELLRRAAAAARRRYGAVSLALVSPATARRLNRAYRRRARVTDVLSFTYSERPVEGEIVICLAQAARQARRRGHALGRELEVLTAHGLLHLAGYDHVRAAERRAMRALEREVIGGAPRR